ncbi:MAG: serine/threonine protein phosphatase [Anaerolineaceae bacterium]|nr:serine/threonine protein phosphatase [Anaerolineaceae bacterium]
MTTSKKSPSTPGTLRVVFDSSYREDLSDREVYLLVGDSTKEKISSLVPDPNLSLPGPSDKLNQEGFQLTVYHFNDLHGHLVRFTPAGEEPVISRMASQIREKQKSVASDPNRAVLTLTAGDDCIGSIFDELLGSTARDYEVHASYQTYSELGVDAACLGNHDFDLGSDLLVRSIKKNAKFPILAANLSGCTELEELCHPAAIIVVKGIRVGVIGLVTQAELKISNPLCEVTNPITAVNNLLPALRPHCDVIIILSHIGYQLSNATIPMKTAGDVELAERLPKGYVHLIVGGHSHHELNRQGLNAKNIVNGIPIVQAGSLGRFLGQVDIQVSNKNTAVTNVRLISTETLPVDQHFETKQIQPLLTQARNLFSRPIGIALDNPEYHTDYIRNYYGNRELSLANFITDGIVYRLKTLNQPVDIGMIDSSSLRRGLSLGNIITMGDWFNIMPFADTIRIYRLTGKQIYDLLQDNASRIDRPNEPHTERGFLHFSSHIRYSIALGLSRSDASVFHITLNGVPIEEQFEKEFLIAGTNFIREYADSWENTENYRNNCPLVDLNRYQRSDTDIFLRTEMVTYIQEKGGITYETGAVCDGRLKIVDQKPLMVTAMTGNEFISHVGSQKHAMAGAVIALSAAQAAALGKACVLISCDVQSISENQIHHLKDQLNGLIRQLKHYADQDANAIAEFVTLRESGQELKGKEFLCHLPYQVASLSIQTSKILEEFRPTVYERVRDDLEMSISLLNGTARTALLLLDSNLRIWPEEELLDQFEPLLNNLEKDIQDQNVLTRIRPRE